MADGIAHRMRAAADQLSAAVQAGNVSTGAHGDAELMGLSATTLQAQQQHAAALRTMEARQRAATIVVPVKDEEIKYALRQLGAPICLFGERLVDRRERLKRILAERQVDAEMLGEPLPQVPQLLDFSTGAVPVKPREAKQTKSFFTEASDALILARQIICANSFNRARERLLKEYNTPVTMGLAHEGSKSVRLEMTASLNELRPISACSFSPTGHLVTGSFDENCRIYKTNGDYSLIATLKGHTERVCDVLANPTSTEEAIHVASASAEGKILLWRNDVCQATLTGHVQRVGRLACDPTGRFLVSSSFDRTWRLWDIQTSTCLLTQDGYAREVYATAFHPDGALISACDLGAACVVWDLRAGKVTHELSGHVLGILSADFAGNGYWLATAGLDNQVRVWDLRKKETLQIIPAHMKTITKVKFAGEGGSSLLVTASHDKTLRIWDCKTWKRASSLVVHDGPVLGMDVSTNSNRMATCGYDKSLKIVDMEVK